LSAVTAQLPLTGSGVGLLIYPQSGAEKLASVTPTNYQFPPGDLRRYGAVAASDITSALSQAAAQAGQAGPAPIYISAALGTACTVTAGVTISTPAMIYGDGYQRSVISTANDITIFTFPLGASGSIIHDLQLIGKGAGATVPGVIYNNSNQNVMYGMLIRLFGIGVQYQTGANSSYLNMIRDSQIISCQNGFNIDCQKATNQLALFNVTFGGSTGTGLRIFDSAGLGIFGGDCEGMTVCKVDIDCPTLAGGVAQGSHSIIGVDFEGGSTSGGDIRIGVSNNQPVSGVIIAGCEFNQGGGSDSGLNLINAAGVTIQNCAINSGYGGSGLIDGFLRVGANATGVVVSNIGSPTFANNSAVEVYGGSVCIGQNPLTGAAPAPITGGTINTNGYSVQRVSPAAAITGVILQAAIHKGQALTIINEAAAANSITMAVAGTSHVADGVSCVIAGLTMKQFIYDDVTALWYHS
jgi:hypothetical protein